MIPDSLVGEDLTQPITRAEFAADVLLNREQAATMLTRVFKRATMRGWTLDEDAQFQLNYNKPIGKIKKC